MNTKPYTFDRVVRLVIGLAVILLLFLLVKRLSTALLPFLSAWLMAYLLHPIVCFFQYKLKLKNRILSIIVTLVLLAGVLVGLVLFLTPLINSEVEKMSTLIVLYTQGFTVDTFLPSVWQDEIRNYLSQLNVHSAMRDENIVGAVKKLAPQLWMLVNGSLSFLFGLTVVLVVFMYLIFILLDYENIAKGMFQIIPPKYRPLITDILLDLEQGMNRYFRGQALVALIVGVLFTIGFSIVGLPLAIVTGLLLGVLTLVPYLKIIGVLPCLILALLQSAQTGQSYWSVLLGIAIVFAIVQGIEDFFLVPKIMGRVTGLNPAVILLSLSVWGSLMGMIGLIIALPMTTLVISYYKRFVLHADSRPASTEAVILPESPQQEP